MRCSPAMHRRTMARSAVQVRPLAKRVLALAAVGQVRTAGPGATDTSGLAGGPRCHRLDAHNVRAHRTTAGAKDTSPADHALGRSRSGWDTKVHLLTDGMGLALVAALTPGQAGEAPQATALLERVGIASLRCASGPNAWLATRPTATAISAPGCAGAMSRPSSRSDVLRWRAAAAGGPTSTRFRTVVGIWWNAAWVVSKSTAPWPRGLTGWLCSS
jgi:hypothetical protein